VAALQSPRQIKTLLGEWFMRSLTSALAVLGLTLAASPVATSAWAQAAGEKGPERIVWAAHKTPDSPYAKPNRPIWHIADILKAHQGKASWDQPVLLTRDYDGHYVSMAPGEKLPAAAPAEWHSVTGSAS
jgi:hypothetical protein